MNKPLEPLESECTLVGDMSKWEREKWNIIERRKGSTSLHKVCHLLLGFLLTIITIHFLILVMALL